MSSPVAALMILMCEVLDEDQNAGSGVGAADADVVQAAVDAQGDGAGSASTRSVRTRLWVSSAVAWGGFGAGRVGGGRGGAVGQ